MDNNKEQELENNNKEQLEKIKLIEEIRVIQKQNRVIDKIIVPITASIFTIILGIFSLLLQSNYQKNQTFIKLLEQATTAKSPEGRIAGIWMLNSYWDNSNSDKSNRRKIIDLLNSDKDDLALYKPIANTLSGIVTSDEDYFVRLAAAEVIGNAYKNEDKSSQERIKSLRFLLYGDGETGENGTLTWANQRLKLRCSDENDSEKKVICSEKLYATKQAIRKNWENLENVNLKLTDLSEAELYEARLKNANLTGSILQKTKLKEADLTGAIFDGADLTGANLTGANLTEAKFREYYPANEPSTKANLTGANLTEANLTKANLTGANLTEANLTKANLIDTNLQKASLKGTNFTKALYNKNTNFNDIQLSPNIKIPNEDMYLIAPDSNLNGADLSNADLSNADLSNADLSNADLSNANLTGAIVKDTKYNKNTTFPDDFDPKAAEMIEVK